MFSLFEPAFSHRAQRGGLRRYVEDVLSDSRRKSMESMGPRLRDPGSYQALHYLITEADWNADEVWRRLRTAIPAREGILVPDGTGFWKQGRASVGVSRDYWARWARSARDLVDPAQRAHGRIGTPLHTPYSTERQRQRRRDHLSPRRGR